jgi:hypothetical protein
LNKKDKDHRSMKSAKTVITAKEKRRRQILEFCGNPTNSFPSRYEMATAVCGYKDNSGLYRLFNSSELAEIEREALEMRRAKYASQIAKIDTALMQKAIEGDVAACKLCYQRFEGWSEKQKKEHSVDGDSLAQLLREIDGKTSVLPRLPEKT